MSITKPLEEMSVAEKIQMMESLWDDLCQKPDGIESPAWHQDILAQREESLGTGEDAFEDWDSAKSNIRKQVPSRSKILASASQDLLDGYRFYEKQAEGVGRIFSIRSSQTLTLW